MSNEDLFQMLADKDEEIEILKDNFEVANEDLTRIAQLLNLEEGCTIYDIEDKIERLKQGYCELKEKCNKGECDCTNEEYNSMCEENIKMDLEIERLNNIIKEVREYIENTPRVVKSTHYRDKESNYAFIENYVKGEILEKLDKVNNVRANN